MEQWWLIDYGRPLERPEDDDSPYDYYAEMAIESAGQLQAELARLRREGRPTFLSLVSPSKESLSIGLGPKLSGLLRREGHPGGADKIALNPRPLTDEPHGFADGNGGFVFEPEYLFPTDEVIEAALQFYRSGRLPDSLQWERWWPRRHPATRRWA
jgi:hypothetical protein